MQLFWRVIEDDLYYIIALIFTSVFAFDLGLLIGFIITKTI